MNLIMRNLIVLAVVIISATSSFAESYPKVSFNENKTLVLNLNDWAGLEVQIEIKEMNGEILYSDKIQKGDLLSKQYNLKKLPAGTYELVVHSDLKKATYPILVTFKTVEMLPVDNPVIFKSAVAYKNNAIEFNQLALGRNITFSINDQTGTFFTKTFKNEASINKKFDVTELPEGDYTVTVSGNNQYDTYYFEK